MNIVLPPKEFWQPFKETNGAMSCAEAVALFNVASAAPPGVYLELGSHKGKSSQAIAYAIGDLKAGATFAMVEPEFKNPLWEKEVVDRVSPIIPQTPIQTWPGYSLDVLPQYDSLSFVFVDSGVHDDMVMEEAKMLEDKMVQNGIIALHDFLNQFTAVERAYNYLLGTGKYQAIIIDWWQVFEYVAENGGEADNISWHQYPELPHPPNFIGALKRL